MKFFESFRIFPKIKNFSWIWKISHVTATTSKCHETSDFGFGKTCNLEPNKYNTRLRLTHMFCFCYSFEKMNCNTNLILRNYRILSKSSFDICGKLRHLVGTQQVERSIKSYTHNFKVIAIKLIEFQVAWLLSQSSDVKLSILRKNDSQLTSNNVRHNLSGVKKNYSFFPDSFNFRRFYTLKLKNVIFLVPNILS